jgi:hypothetical protein
MYKLPDQRFSFDQSYSFTNRVVTTQLKQPYWVTNRAKADFQRKNINKLKTDEKVEAQVIRRLDKACSKAKKEKRQHLKKAQEMREKSSHRDHELYMKRAGQVDLSQCVSLKESEEII